MAGDRNGTRDHVHLLVRLLATTAAADLVRVLKANSSRWVHDTSPARRTFAWQSEYAAFSVSQSNVPAVTKYIAEQEAHHRRISFQDDLRMYLRRNGIA